MIEIPHGPSIPESELTLVASRSGGPGGQHVNKVSSRITLRWDVAGSPSLAPDQRARVLEELGNRIDGEGILQIHAQASRSQAENRRAVVERLVRLLERAFRPRTPRVATRVPAGEKRRRVESKKRRAAVKAGRRPDPEE